MKKLLKIITDIVFVLFAATLGAIATKYFILPLNLNMGGVYGVSVILARMQETSLAIPLNLSYFSFVYILLNLPLIIFAYFKLGKRLVLNSLIFVMWVPFILRFLPETQIIDVSQDKLTWVMIGAILFGLSSAIAYKGNATAGGIDVLAIYISKKYRNISIAHFIIIQAITIFALTQVIYNSRFGSPLLDERLIYSIIFYTINGAAINYAFPRHRIIKCTVIAKQHKQLLKIIHKVFPHKSYTIYNVVGKRGNESKAVDIVMSYYESKDLIRMLKQYDIDNFFFTSRVIRAHKDFAAFK